MIHRAAIAFVGVLVLFSFSLASARSSPAAPIAPTALAQFVNGNKVAPGSWINSTTVEVRFQITGNGSMLTPQVEWRPANQSFIGQPNYAGQAVSPAPNSTTTVSLWVHGLRNNASYMWQARVVDDHGNASPWTSFTPHGQIALQVDTKPPTRPQITSPTNPRWGFWYNTRVERFQWLSTDNGSGIAGYSFHVDHRAGGQPGQLVQRTRIALYHLVDGHWVLHVWARDRAGNWSQPAIYRFNLDRTPAKVRFISSANHWFNPYAGKETWRFTISKWARIAVAIMRSGQKQPVMAVDLGKLSPGDHTYVWNGRDREGHIARAGWYWLHVTTVDSLGNQSNFSFGGVHVRPIRPQPKHQAPQPQPTPISPQSESGKHIVVSLSRQELYAYDGNRLVLSTPVTTGNPALPTPVGHYTIFAKFHPFEFVSPWPVGSPYYYPPSWVSYAMEFIQGGYFIHDAPWRSAFGPGTDGPGQPGTNYGGTHGCVNTPFAAAQFLYYWAPIGTPVDVVP
jgi:lipoprotein-anchoring transpeptidase ErfK/SrfK